MANYRDLEVWKQGRSITKLAYEFSAELPKDERFGLKSQIQRAAVSIPSNISEGAGRGGDKSFLHFIRIAIGSLNELETLVLLTVDVGLMSSERTKLLESSMRDLSVRLWNLATKLERDLKEPREKGS